LTQGKPSRRSASDHNMLLLSADRASAAKQKQAEAETPLGKREISWREGHGRPDRSGWGGRVRTSEWRDQNPLPYHLATPQQDREARYKRPCETRRNIPASLRGCNRMQRLPIQAESGAALPRSRLRPRGLTAITPPRIGERSVAQSGSAPRSGRGGRRFESCHSDH
jgi:hypothetical protein